MVLKTDKILKRYYSIKEVAQLVGVSESNLRYWEKEFPSLRPKTTAQNVRQYTEKDIALIKVIYNLLRVRGLKIAAARKLLARDREAADRSSEVLDTLIAVRDELKDIKRRMDTLL